MNQPMVMRRNERTGPVMVERVGQVLAERPAVRGAVAIDDAHLILAEPVDAILVEEELRVLRSEHAWSRSAGSASGNGHDVHLDPATSSAP